MPCRLLAVVWLSVMLGLVACGESKRAAPNPISGSPNAQPIDGNPLTQVQPGMTKGQVRNMVGPPRTENGYWTWLSWLPGSFNDQRRSAWHYEGLGTVVFSEPRFGGGAGQVLDVDIEETPRSARR